ncbi:MAG TPA: hypothetical protein VG223_03365 [Solirubrobacteraceae bacterium]|nr:hypothetical protein [Solirubrobacteraceae bacterium]
MPDHSTHDPGPDLDRWVPRPSLRIAARRESSADPARLWRAAQAVPLAETGLLGRLVRWRIPGTTAHVPFGVLFREPPFLALEERDGVLVSGLVGRIWTLRRDYPVLDDPAQFAAYDQRGSARVLFGHWVEPAGEGRWALASEARVEPLGLQGRLGVGAVRPLVRRFGPLVGSEGLAAAVRRAEG